MPDKRETIQDSRPAPEKAPQKLHAALDAIYWSNDLMAIRAAESTIKMLAKRLEPRPRLLLVKTPSVVSS